jgi:hypothetical protein
MAAVIWRALLVQRKVARVQISAGTLKLAEGFYSFLAIINIKKTFEIEVLLDRPKLDLKVFIECFNEFSLILIEIGWSDAIASVCFISNSGLYS